MVARFILASLLFGGVFIAPAAAQTWDGDGTAGGNINWSFANNWNPDGVPANNGTANIIMAGTIDTANTVDVNFDINSLSFDSTAATFSIIGGQLTIGAGGLSNASGNAQSIGNNIVTSAAQTWATAASGAITLTGTVDNGGGLLTVSPGANGAITFNGAISGSAGLTKTGSGTLSLSGTTANTFTGTTTVQDGTLLLNKDTGVMGVLDGAMAGPLVIGQDGLPAGTAIARWLGCCQLPDDTDVTINSSGLLDVNGFGDNIHNLILNGGRVNAPTPGSILPTGDITVNSSASSQAVISGRMSVVSNPIINVNGHFFSPDLKIDAVLIGAGGFTKDGEGTLGLTGANTYTGAVTINAGILNIQHPNALGTVAGGVTLAGGATLQIEGGLPIGAEALSMGNAALVENVSGTNTYGGLLSFTGGGAHIKVDAGTLNLTNTGAIVGTTTLDIDGPGDGSVAGAFSADVHPRVGGGGTWTFSGRNNNTTATLYEGVLKLSVSGRLGSTSVHLIYNGGTLDLNRTSQTIGQLEIGGDANSHILNNASGTFSTFTVGNGDASGLFNGTIIDHDNGGSGKVELTKIGAGTFTLNGANTYTGATRVNGGTLLVNGSITSATTVSTGGTLGGIGTVGAVTVNSGGFLAPGNGTGPLTAAAVTFGSGTPRLVIELGGTAPGTQHDVLNVTGTASLGGQLNIAVTGGFVPNFSDTFTVLNAGSLLNAFTNVANGARLTTTTGGGSFIVHYGPMSTFNANQVVLTNFVLPGDYNHNGIVDAADYTVWRNSLGQVAPNLPADGNNDGMITRLDYNVWKLHYGQLAGSGSAEVVPEPATWLMLSLVALLFRLRFRRGPQH